MKKIVPARKFRRTSAEKLRDRARIAEMHLKGFSSYKIAEELATSNPYRLDPSTIRNDINKIEEQWRSGAIGSVDRLRITQAERIKRIMWEAWEAWEASKRPQQERTTIGVPTDLGGTQKVKEVRVMAKERCGDPAYLHVVQSAITELNKLFGLYHRVDESTGNQLSSSPTIECLGIDPAHAHAVLEEEFLLKLKAGQYSGHPIFTDAIQIDGSATSAGAGEPT